MIRAGAATKAESFRRLAAEHLDDSYRLARAILGNSVDAEDATHDAFMRAWRKFGTLRDADRFDAWFGRILVNTCRNRLRDRGRRRASDLSPEITRLQTDPYGEADDRELLRSAIARLSPDHRVIVALRFFGDLPIREVALRLGIREGTAHSRLHYALRNLRQLLDEEAMPGESDE